MSELDDAVIAFFRALRACGKETFGHDRFGFKLDVNTMVAVDDTENAHVFNAKLQAALSLASNVVQPVTIEGSSLQ